MFDWINNEFFWTNAIHWSFTLAAMATAMIKRDQLMNYSRVINPVLGETND